MSKAADTNNEAEMPNGQVKGKALKIKVLFGTKKGQPEYTEELITEVEEDIPAATKWAEAQGYVVRIAEIDLDTPPEFGRNVLNI